MKLEDSTLGSKYTLHFPFWLSPNQQMPAQTYPVQKKLKCLTLTFGVPILNPEYKENFYVITVQGFDSKESAEEYFNHLWAGLVWMLLNRGIGFNITKDIQNSDGDVIDVNLPAVYPSDKQPITIGALLGDFIFKIDFEQFYSPLLEGATVSKNSMFISDLSPELKLALELYNSCCYEQLLPKPKFLMLIIILETLANAYKKENSDKIRQLVNEWNQQIKQRIKELEANQEDYKQNKNHEKLEELKAVKSIEGRLKHLKDNSLLDRIKNLVIETLKVNEFESQKYKKTLNKLYGIRSTLVHEGKIKDGKSFLEDLQEAEHIVQAVLKAKFCSIVEIHN
ncbi:hypothetical protein [Funiculus sociatus]|uniref:hypothetical protein n=1 Tax=Funiculus sociatus TaxID=450527 RepID=UPI003299B715